MKIVVVGNGIAGYTAASEICRLAKKLNEKIDVTIVTKEKTPIYSPCIFHLYLSGQIERDRLFIHSYREYREKGIKLVFGEVKEVRDESILVEGYGELPYDKLVLAIGSKPAIPPIKGVNLNGVFTCKTISDIDEVKSYLDRVNPRRAVIIGAGLIGVEMAVALRMRGIEVCLVELMPRVLPLLLDEEASNIVLSELEKNKVKVHLNARVLEIMGDDRVNKVVLDSGDEIESQIVIVATGMKPNTEILRKTGIRLGDRGGIIVDRYMMTSKRDIYACGDCIEYKDAITNKPTINMLWINSRIQGEITASNIIGIEREYLGEYNITGVSIFNKHVIAAGRKEEELRGRKYDVVEEKREDRYYKIIISDGKIIGFQLIGEFRVAGILHTLAIKKVNIQEMIKKIELPRQLRLIPYSMKLI